MYFLRISNVWQFHADSGRVFWCSFCQKVYLQYYTFNQTLKQPSTLSFISSDESKKKRVNIRACQVKKSIFLCCPSQVSVSFLYEIFVGGNSKDTFLMSIRRCVWEVSVYFFSNPANLFSQQTFSMKTSRDNSYYSRISYRWQFCFPSHFVFKLLKYFFSLFFFWLRYVLNHCNHDNTPFFYPPKILLWLYC